MNTARFTVPNSSRYSPDWYSNNIEILPVRVIDIILDSSHPEYSKYDTVTSIGAIKYSLIDKRVDTSDPKKLPVAFPINRNFTNYPLKNEVVFIIRGPKSDTSIDENHKHLERVDYYMPAIGISNDVNFLPYKDVTEDTEEVTASYSTEESFDNIPGIRPLHPFNGDVILEGRNGQSIRMSGAKSKNNPFTDSSNIQDPVTIITNGHEEISTQGLYIENINKDKSSVYLTSNHVIPLNQAKLKYAGAKERPIQADKYQGAQIVVSSGRLFFNSHTDDIQFTSTTDFGVSAKNVYLDGEDYLTVDAKKIYLGEKAKLTENQPVILGDVLENFLKTLLEALQQVGSSMKTAKVIDGKPIPLLNLNGAGVEATAKLLLNQINPGGKSILKSKKTFVE